MTAKAGVIRTAVLASIAAVSVSSGLAQSQAAQAVDAQAAQAKATIIFYRPGAFYGKALKPSIFVDGNEIGRLKSGKYIAYQTTAGKHSLASTKKDTAVEINVSSDQPQYVEMLIQSGTWRGAGRLVPVPAEEGKCKADQLKGQED